MVLGLKFTCTEVAICHQTPLVVPIAPNISTIRFLNMLNPNLQSELHSDHSRHTSFKKEYFTDTWSDWAIMSNILGDKCKKIRQLTIHFFPGIFDFDKRPSYPCSYLVLLYVWWLVTCNTLGHVLASQKVHVALCGGLWEPNSSNIWIPHCLFTSAEWWLIFNSLGQLLEDKQSSVKPLPLPYPRFVCRDSNQLCDVTSLVLQWAQS